MDLGLRGKNALITGSGGTLGFAEAETFAQNGVNIMIHDMKEDACRASVEKLKKYDVRVSYFVCDITDAAACKEMVDKTVSELGSIDILINNAGMNIGGKDRLPFCDYRIPCWDLAVDVNADGAFYCSKYAAPYMIAQKSGKIINISSVEGTQGNRLQPAYVAAKAAMISMTRSMAEELGQYGISVTSVAPGSTLNPGVAAVFYSNQEVASRFLSNIPLGRPGVPEDVANACLYFASIGAYVTGQVLPVDGGWTGSYSREWPLN